MDYFGSNPHSRQALGASLPDLLASGGWRLRPQIPVWIQWLKYVQGPTSIQRFWLMQMLGNFGAKQNLYFIFSAPLPCPKNIPASLSKNGYEFHLALFFAGSLADLTHILISNWSFVKLKWSPRWMTQLAWLSIENFCLAAFMLLCLLAFMLARSRCKIYLFFVWNLLFVTNHDHVS